MKNILYALLVLTTLSACATRKPANDIVDKKEVTRILNTLASDEMQGRASFTPGIELAAGFISEEYKKIGLLPFEGDDYRQTFHVTRVQPATYEVTFDGNELADDRVIISSNNPGINWNDEPGISLLEIKKGESFADRFREIANGGKDAIVLIDSSFSSLFARYKGFLMRSRTVSSNATGNSIVYVLGSELPKSFRVSFTNTIEELPLSNIVGVLPGKSKADEYVIFSGHYDHIGILEPVGQDSIANGADDDASGVSAVISLAQYFKKKGDNERTILFVAFTAEEIGLVGSKYFSENIDADKVVAMFNIEMIGKDAKFGPNSLYLTGYNQSNLGEIMQRNVAGTAFTFHPDPYPTQNLFYRSDNASLAAVGVPAHTLSTSQIDKDQYYHTVKDEVETLDIENIVSSIKAIAIGSRSIIAGEDAPTRVPKLQP